MELAELALQAMRAGLNGAKLPSFGDRLTKDQLKMVNKVYDEARNWSAGSRVRARS